jgi:hypothetical protein
MTFGEPVASHRQIDGQQTHDLGVAEQVRLGAC